VYDHNHQFRRPVPVIEQGFYGRKITIGNNVWLGAGCFICSGVNIGDNAVIGANTVITKDVPSDTVVVAVQNIKQTSYERAE
jgi:acetyltransferase-like isoleucine patch superfamily enzyme